jgi:hypothetical protein
MERIEAGLRDAAIRSQVAKGQVQGPKPNVQHRESHPPDELHIEQPSNEGTKAEVLRELRESMPISAY